MLTEKLIIRKPNIKIILVGFLSFFRLTIFNALICPLEVCGILYFAYCLLIPRKDCIEILGNNIYKNVEKLLILWSFTQLISDIFNQSDFKSSFKGILTPIVILLSSR